MLTQPFQSSNEFQPEVELLNKGSTALAGERAKLQSLDLRLLKLCPANSRLKACLALDDQRQLTSSNAIDSNSFYGGKDSTVFPARREIERTYQPSKDLAGHSAPLPAFVFRKRHSHFSRRENRSPHHRANRTRQNFRTRPAVSEGLLTRRIRRPGPLRQDR